LSQPQVRFSHLWGAGAEVGEAEAAKSGEISRTAISVSAMQMPSIRFIGGGAPASVLVLYTAEAGVVGACGGLALATRADDVACAILVGAKK